MLTVSLVVDPVMAQLMRDKQRHASGVDIIGNLLRSPLDERFPSELAEDGFVQWVSVNAAQGTGLVHFFSDKCLLKCAFLTTAPDLLAGGCKIPLAEVGRTRAELVNSGSAAVPGLGQRYHIRRAHRTAYIGL